MDTPFNYYDGTPIRVGDVIRYQMTADSGKKLLHIATVRFGEYEDGEGYGTKLHYGFYLTDNRDGLKYFTLPDFVREIPADLVRKLN